MKHNRNTSPCPTGRETLSGACYLAFQLLLLPSLLFWANDRLTDPLSQAELNFLFYLVNFMAMLLIFHNFLGRSMAYALHHVGDTLEAVILGLAAYYACRYLTQTGIRLFIPSFTNYNDATIAALNRSSFFLTFIGTVVLVPPFEECIYRGVLFRNLYSKNPWLAYTVSILAFSAIHILGFLEQYQPLELLIAFAQYLPAGLCLAWSYIRGGSIFAPIAIHVAVNYFTLTGMR